MLIEIRVKEIKAKNEEGEEYSFLAYQGFTKRGWIELKFRKECENVPTKNSYIEVLEENLNINRKNRFPVIWVSKIESVEEITYTNHIDDYFGN